MVTNKLNKVDTKPLIPSIKANPEPFLVYRSPLFKKNNCLQLCHISQGPFPLSLGGCHTTDTYVKLHKNNNHNKKNKNKKQNKRKAKTLAANFYLCNTCTILFPLRCHSCASYYHKNIIKKSPNHYVLRNFVKALFLTTIPIKEVAITFQKI